MNKKGIGILTVTAILFAALFGMKTNEVYAASNSNNNEDGPSISYSSMANCPSNYYSSVEGLKGNALLEKIAEITLKNHKYYTSYGDLAGGLSMSDADVTNPKNKLIDFYTKWSINNTWDHTSGNCRDNCWEKEHVWPKSLFRDSNGSNSFDTTGPGADIHHLRPEIGSVNNHRSNRKFASLENSGGTKYYFVNQNTGQSEFTGCYYSNDCFEPRDEVKGDVARIVMYMYTHYSMDIAANSNHKYKGQFPLTNIVYTSTGTVQAAKNLLMEWNESDPVDEFEMNRNNYCASVTGTRNPYIDHPEYAKIMWDPSYSGNGASGGSGGDIEDYPTSSETISSSITSEETTTISSSPNSSITSSNNSSISTSEETTSNENELIYETKYTIESVSTVSSSGTMPEGVSASFNSTYNSKYQLTSGNSATLTISNLAGYRVNKIILSMKSNKSSGSGSLNITAGDTTLKSFERSSFSSENWNGAWSSEYVDVVFDDFEAYTIKDGEDLEIYIRASTNSLYIKKYTIIYEKVIEVEEQPLFNSIQEVINDYYNKGVYTKKTNVNLSEFAINDIKKHFKGKIDLDRTTYYKGNALLMGDLNGEFTYINSGYGTDEDGNMSHFIWDHENQKTNVDYTISKDQNDNWLNKDVDGMEGFFVTLNDMLQEGYFDEWEGFSYSVSKTNDKYAKDFLAFSAPYLYKAISDTNYITLSKLTISEEVNAEYGKYLCFRIIIDSTSKGIVENEDLILIESRVYKDNKLFDEGY